MEIRYLTVTDRFLNNNELCELHAQPLLQQHWGRGAQNWLDSDLLIIICFPPHISFPLEINSDIFSSNRLYWHHPSGLKCGGQAYPTLMSVIKGVSDMVIVWTILGAVPVPLYSSINTFSSMKLTTTVCTNMPTTIVHSKNTLLSIVNLLCIVAIHALAPLNVQC